MSSAGLGPGDGSILVRTYREGVAAKVGHDLVLEVTRWEASFDPQQVQFTADPRSLEIREANRGVKPLSDRDRAEIRRNLDEKVLGGEPIRFRSTGVERAGDELVVTGELSLAGTTRPITVRLDAGDDRVRGPVTLRQTDWGIKPYRGLMGALKVRDDVEVVLDVRVGGPC
jgi:polyisoprenoid-binding protein YceI